MVSAENSNDLKLIWTSKKRVWTIVFWWKQPLWSSMKDFPPVETPKHRYIVGVPCKYGNQTNKWTVAHLPYFVQTMSQEWVYDWAYHIVIFGLFRDHGSRDQNLHTPDMQKSPKKGPARWTDPTKPRAFLGSYESSRQPPVPSPPPWPPEQLFVLREWSELMLIPLPYRPNTRYNPTLKSPTPGRTHTSPTSKGYFKYGSLKWHRLKPCHTPKMVSSKPIWCDPFARGWNIKE